MQPDSKPSQKRNTSTAKIGHSEDPAVVLLARKMVAEAISTPLPVVALAETLIGTGPADFSTALNRFLARQFWIREIRIARRQLARDAQLRLPGFDHLPLTIPGTKGKPIRLMDASYSRVRAYYRSLMQSHVARRRNDPKIKEVRLLMEKMRKRARRDKGITVQEVLVLDA
jgi:hypothetical protein